MKDDLIMVCRGFYLVWLEIKPYWRFMLTLIVLFSLTLVYWVNSTFVKDIKAAQREGARLAIMEYRSGSNRSLIIPESVIASAIKKYKFTDEDISDVHELKRLISNLEALSENVSH